VDLSEEVAAPPVEPGATHLWTWTSFNPGAFLLAPLWAIGYRAWWGLFVPLPGFLIGLIGYAVPDGINLPVLDFIVGLIAYSVPAFLFAMRADAMAWRSNPGRWTDADYQLQQRRWLLAGVAVLAVQALVNMGNGLFSISLL
jgi:hypothetical protein